MRSLSYQAKVVGFLIDTQTFALISKKTRINRIVNANVSSLTESIYLRPHRINITNNNLVKNGYSWAKAHYLDPIAISHFIITSSNSSDLNSSTIYQNPYWPLTANSGAIE